MPPQLSEDEIDDLLYYARTGDIPEFKTLSDELCTRENITLSTLLSSATDAHTGNGPLHMAAANGHTDILRTLITAVTLPSPQAPTPTTTTTTTTTSSSTHLSLLNAQNSAGNTPLHWAALNGHLECVKALLDDGADPTLVNSAGHDAIYEAELGDRTEVVEWVLREGGEGLEVGVAGEGEGEGEEEVVGDGDGDGDRDLEEGEGGMLGVEGSVSGARAAAAEEEGVRKGMGGLSVQDGVVDHL